MRKNKKDLSIQIYLVYKFKISLNLNKGGIRKLPGNSESLTIKPNEVVHTPPQNETEIRELMHNLEIIH